MIMIKASAGLSAAVLASLATLAQGAQPPNVVVSDGAANTAMGTSALLSLTEEGYGDTAAGYEALTSNTSGEQNAAFGFWALRANTTGDANTATGAFSLTDNTTGSFNTAFGLATLSKNTTGSENSAGGIYALYYNTTGTRNTAYGVYALQNNTTGSGNAASGALALVSNTTGGRNAAHGTGALYRNTAGTLNSALGTEALYGNSTGFRNVAVGYRAGYSIRGKDNITIGAVNFGKTTDNGVIRIGSANQVKTYIAGISGVKTGAASVAAVFVDANGQLGTIKSSREYKEDIRPMGSVSERLYALQPVTFHYREAYDDGSKPLEFGLIAEEVAEAFPELVVKDAEGRPQTVRYDLVATLLLNEFQKEHATVAELKQQVAALAAVIDRLQQQHAEAGGR